MPIPDPQVAQFVAEVQVSPSTRRAYERQLLYLAPWLDEHGLTVEELSWGDFLQFIADRRWGPSTARQAQSALRKYLGWLGIQGHPVQRQALHREDPESGFVVTPEVITRLGQAMSMTSHKDLRNWSMLLTSFHGALRSSELVNVRIQDLDFARQKIYVRAGKQGRKEHAPFPATSPIGGGPQIWVDRYLERVRPLYVNATDRLWVGINGRRPGGPMTASGWGSICRRWGQRAGIEGFSPHACRRGFAHHFTRQGVATTLVMKAGRWRDYRSYRRYTLDLDIDDFIQALGAAA